MPRLIGDRLPKYRKHRASGQAIVSVAGRDFYLGPWNSAVSRNAYDTIISEWLANGRQLAQPGRAPLSINELAARYLEFALRYYTKDGKPAGTLDGIKVALRWLCENYGRTTAGDFGPLALRTLQNKMIAADLSRSYINNLIDRVRRTIKWAVSEELIPVTIHQSLLTVPGLRRGRSAARESAPVRSVTDEVVNATLPFLRSVVADMVRVQRLTGCRPEEVCLIRPMDIDCSQDVWSYRPEHHKTEYRGRERVIFIGPRAQNILRSYLNRAPELYCFSPKESEAEHNHKRRSERKSPMTPSQLTRGRRAQPARSPGNRYTSASYRRSIHRACDAADRHARLISSRAKEDERLVVRWSPNQLRHSTATLIRQQFGLEAAQVTLGHASADITQIYAERDQSKASAVMRALG